MAPRMKLRYQKRRATLMDQLPDNTIVLMSGAKKHLRSGDQFFPFWQYANFHYLTGWPEPDATLIIQRQGREMQSIIFHSGYDPVDEKWHGKSLSHQEAKELYGFDEAYACDALDQWLHNHINKFTALYLTSTEKSPAPLPKRLMIDNKVLDAQLTKLRLYKDHAELEAMKKACSITVSAHLDCMRQGVNGAFSNEQEVAATFQYQCAMRMAEGLAYESIAASGQNACILHYTKNNMAIEPSSCVLLDAGCSVDHYCADVTRCWPASGKFTSQQRIIYQLVLETQQACIAKIAAGVAYQDLKLLSQTMMIDGLKQCKIVDQSASDEVLFSAFYGHGLGHFIGLDVHDPGPGSKDFQLEENMVITIEPGLYLRDCALLVDKSFAGIGIRIEDNILVQKDHGFNLTDGVPVRIDEIESLVYG